MVKYIQKQYIVLALKFEGSIMKVGNSLSVILPKPICDNFGIKKGDTLSMFADEHGIFIPLKQKEVIKDVMEKWVKDRSK